MHQMKVLTPTMVATEEGTAPRVALLKLVIESLSKRVTSPQKELQYIVTVYCHSMYSTESS